MRTLLSRVVAAKPAPAAARTPVTLADLDATVTPVEWLETLADMQLRVLGQVKGMYARRVTQEDREILATGPAPYLAGGPPAGVAVAS